MIGLLLLFAVVIAVLLQIVAAPLARSATPPRWLRPAARLLTIVGAAITVAPLAPLLFDLLAVSSAAEAMVLVLFVLFSLALILPVWIWLFVATRREALASACAFVIAAALGNIVIAVTLYRGLFSGVADAQDGVVIQIVPLLQIVVTAVAAFTRRLLRRSARGAQMSGLMQRT